MPYAIAAAEQPTSSSPGAVRSPDPGAAFVRYQIKSLDRAIAFYTQKLGFSLEQRTGAVFARISRGNLHLLLSGPGSSASRPLPDGRLQEPGRWYRIVLPLGKGSAEKVAVKYPSNGGYTPGDTWELYVGTDGRIRELVFHHGGPEKPSVVIATWADYKKAGPLLLSLDQRGTADGKPFRLFFSNVAVKLGVKHLGERAVRRSSWPRHLTGEDVFGQERGHQHLH